MGAKAPCLGWLVGGRVEILMCYTCGCVQKEVWISDLELRIQAIIETLNLGVLNILVRTCMPRSEYGVERACVLYPQPPCTLCTVVTRLIIVQLSAEGSAVSLSSTLKVRPFHFFFFLFFFNIYSAALDLCFSTWHCWASLWHAGSFLVAARGI